MYHSKFNKTMSKTDETILDKIALRISGIDFFCLNEDTLTINDLKYFSYGMSINSLRKVIEENGGTVTIEDTSLLTLPVGVLGLYSNWMIVKVKGSPVNLEKISYRYTDIEYEYSPLTDTAKIINGKYMSSLLDNEMVLKKTKVFLLMKIYDEYIGV